VTWTKLGDHPDERIWRGTVFRCRGVYPHEEVVDFLLVDIPHLAGFGLVVATGYKAGLPLAVLPEEARIHDEKVKAISASWLLANWTERIYDCDPHDVYVIDGYRVDQRWFDERDEATYPA
jgi:hypothetical protein